ncbi:MAG: F0F1 ATP synthase subunit alpha [Lachnospiraceae bacterium]|nr:F0F1 ATP synthase subunit alpha [Lachnospiraceae bacterium]
MRRATLYCVTPPSEEQIARMKAFLAKEEDDPEIELSIEIEPSLVSGFILRTERKEYDWSMYGRVEQLRSALGVVHGRRPKKTVANLKKCIEEFELAAGEKEYGTVTFVGDGIAVVTGLDHACYGEIVTFSCGVKGMVMDIRRDETGVILFGRDTEIFEGSLVTRTYRMAGMPVGDSFIGRIVDALGEPIDGQGEIVSSDFRPLENPAPGIMDRQPVTTSMETGILAIDSMFPIGRGQRELIIGDRQTGKTSIALDTILNQKGKNVVCIYVAIGQKASTIAKMVTTLTESGAMDYTVVVTSTASDPAPLQYIAPYSGTALAEYFMYSGRDVLIVYDDLSKHAVAYRAISLLLERSPGREAYPGDVFYLHSRLLERSSRLSDELGGGSITALPIIETLNGDVSAYIPTNVISITDGQIYLESELFFEGQRPAVNVGLSVSRVGGAAQSSVMKQASGTVRIDLAQYREIEVFTQFSSELDESTKRQLSHGRALMELLKQPIGHSLSMPEQVLLLQAANRRLFENLTVRELTSAKYDYLTYVRVNHPEVIEEISQGDKLRKSQLERLDAIGERWLMKRKEEKENGERA